MKKELDSDERSLVSTPDFLAAVLLAFFVGMLLGGPVGVFCQWITHEKGFHPTPTPTPTIEARR